MSQIIMAFEDVPSPDLRLFRKEHGVLNVLGSSKGNSLILIVDLLENKLIYWAFYSLTAIRPIEPEKEEVSAMMLFRGIGNILALADGRVTIVTNE